MNKPSPKPQPARWLSAKWLAPLIGIPILVSIGVAGWYAYQESMASRALEELIRPIRAAGEPFGDAWLEQQFRQKTSTEGTAAWSKILTLCSSGLRGQGELPLVGSGSIQPMLDPSLAWEANDRVREFLDEVRPVIDLIHASTTCPKPVWQPMVFDGIETLLPELQDSRSVVRLLALDAEHALYNGDAERALAAITSMQATAEVFDWNLFQVGEFVNLAHREMHRFQILRSLHTPLWTAEQIDQLMDQVSQPKAVAQSWRAALISEEVLALSSIQRGHYYSPEVQWVSNPSAELQFVRYYRQLQNMACESASDLAKQAAQFEEELYSNGGSGRLILGQFMPATSSFAQALERDENSRRLTLTSLAVKKFQMTHQTWPEDLAALSDVGLTAEDWTIPNAGKLGYSAEGETAYVWGVNYVRDGRSVAHPSILPQRPTFTLEDSTQQNDAIGMIR